MKIAMGNDHTAIELKNIIKEFVEGKGYEVIDLGTNSTESCDYPVYGEKVGRAVASKEADLGIVICGTGVGISLAANKVKGVRACVCVLILNAVLKLFKTDVVDIATFLIFLAVLAGAAFTNMLYFRLPLTAFLLFYLLGILSGACGGVFAWHLSRRLPASVRF